ncbi:hypothetical protein C8J57DRAFT_1642808 [Mycena rebaudengoi]|nr:hypothetical protein C8J57DRAFT_1642808 [Mycena rebaudengoi]
MTGTTVCDNASQSLGGIMHPVEDVEDDPPPVQHRSTASRLLRGARSILRKRTSRNKATVSGEDNTDSWPAFLDPIDEASESFSDDANVKHHPPHDSLDEDETSGDNDASDDDQRPSKAPRVLRGVRSILKKRSAKIKAAFRGVEPADNTPFSDDASDTEDDAGYYEEDEDYDEDNNYCEGDSGYEDGEGEGEGDDEDEDDDINNPTPQQAVAIYSGSRDLSHSVNYSASRGDDNIRINVVNVNNLGTTTSDGGWQL